MIDSSNQYDFDQLHDRYGQNSVKWDLKKGQLPMWIADMDFKTSPEVIDAMKTKVDQGIFGYEYIPDEYFQAVAGWYLRRHHLHLKKDWMIFSTGVVPSISSVVRRLTEPGDKVLVTAPVYDIFYHSIENNGRRTLSSDLVFDEEKASYSIDFVDLETKMADPLTSLMILCNPHNPVGRVWSKEELTKIAELCNKHGVYLLSDEIHGDLVFKEPEYTSAAFLPKELSKRLVVCVSPSKSFNLAALHAATVIVPDPLLRASVSRGLNNDELAEPNLLAVTASIAAYTKGDQWMAALKNYIWNNRNFVSEYLAENIPDLKLISKNATYLLWIDSRKISDDSQKLADFIFKDTGLLLSAGSIYRGNGHDFLRMNVACPRKMVADALDRLKRSIDDFSN